MKKMYELGKSPGDGRFYINGELKENGSIDKRGWVDVDHCDGSITYSKRNQALTPEYLGHIQVDPSYKLGSVDVRALIARSIGARHEILSDLEGKELDLPERTNAFHVEVNSIKLNLPAEWRSYPELFVDTVAFLRIEEPKSE